MAKVSSRAAAAASALQVFLLFMSAVGVMGLRRAELLSNTSSSKVSIDYTEIVSAIVSFGDSTTDVGNNDYLITIVKSDFLPYGRDFPAGPTGRFCDGKLIIDYITESIGYPFALPYLAPNAKGDAILTGINFASAASGWWDYTSVRYNVASMTTQFSWYKNWQKDVVSLVGQEKGNNIISNALYVFSTGTNDWINNYYNDIILMATYTPDAYAAFLVGLARSYLQELYDLGGRNIGVIGVPPFGCLPSEITSNGLGNPGCIEDFNKDAMNYNRQLQAMLNDLSTTFHGGRLFYLDIYTLAYNIIQNPQQYGFQEVRRGCCGTGYFEVAILCNEASIGTCVNDYPFVFWDSVHGTTRVYEMLAADMFSQAALHIVAPLQP